MTEAKFEELKEQIDRKLRLHEARLRDIANFKELNIEQVIVREEIARNGLIADILVLTETYYKKKYKGYISPAGFQKYMKAGERSVHKVYDAYKGYVKPGTPEFDKAAKEICQFFEPPQQPEIPEAELLLSEEESVKAAGLEANYLNDVFTLKRIIGCFSMVNKAQLAKVQPKIQALEAENKRLDKEVETWQTEAWNKAGRVTELGKELEQARRDIIQMIFKRIEELAKNRRRTSKHMVNYITMSHETWEALKKQEGIE
jgi:hypothetical protein